MSREKHPPSSARRPLTRRPSPRGVASRPANDNQSLVSLPSLRACSDDDTPGEVSRELLLSPSEELLAEELVQAFMAKVTGVR